MTISIDLGGQVILVCGVSRGGIGGAAARRIATAGATVFAVDILQEALDQTTADIEAAGGQCHGLRADLMDLSQTDSVVPAVLQRFGRLDGVANVAGGTRPDEWMPLEETPTEAFRMTMNINFEYVFRICRDAARAMIQHDIPGSIVNVTSVMALASAPFHGAYGAGKSAMAALTRTMAFEWARYGIRANSVAPGAVPTARTMARQNSVTQLKEAGDVVLTTTDELANTIVFLLSDLASGISGQHLPVDSGLSTKSCVGYPRMDAHKRSLRV